MSKNSPTKKGTRPAPRLPLHDKQSERDTRELRIDKVGVRGLRFPIQVMDKARSTQNTIATIGMFVDLPKEFKGTHMSRFIEVLNAHGTVVHVENIEEILHAMRAKLHAESAHLEMEFPFFMTKHAPVTGRAGVMDYTARFAASAHGASPYDEFRAVSCGGTGSCTAVGIVQRAPSVWEAFSQTLANGAWGTAALADFHLQIRPGTDAWCLAALVFHTRS